MFAEDHVCPPCKSSRSTAAALCPGHTEHPARVTGHMHPSSQLRFPTKKKGRGAKEPGEIACLRIKKTR